MVKIIIIGTDKNIPIIPQMFPQITSDNIKTNGLRFKLLPVNLGSIMLPIISWVTIIPMVTIVNGRKVSLNCNNDSSIGKTEATIEPKVGM